MFELLRLPTLKTQSETNERGTEPNASLFFFTLFFIPHESVKLQS